MSAPADIRNRTKYKDNRRYYYDRHLKISYLLDEFGESFYALEDKDLVKTVSLSLPISLLDIVDKKRRSVSRSRFIRKCIETALEVDRVY